MLAAAGSMAGAAIAELAAKENANTKADCELTEALKFVFLFLVLLFLAQNKSPWALAQNQLRTLGKAPCGARSDNV